jgi:CDGSH-type Zn-finger protein
MDKPKVAETTPIKVALETGKTYYWCACGRSKNQPFCDGSHKVTTITPLAFTVDEPKEKMLCRCKQTANPPYCDGSHKKL